MLRSPSPDALAALLSAARSSDVDLDLALLRLGILAPASLDEIRAALLRPDAELAATQNRDGHRIVEVVVARARTALIHHDGRVQHLLDVAV
jgi:hypothetical protein